MPSSKAEKCRPLSRKGSHAAHGMWHRLYLQAIDRGGGGEEEEEDKERKDRRVSGEEHGREEECGRGRG